MNDVVLTAIGLDALILEEIVGSRLIILRHDPDRYPTLLADFYSSFYVTANRICTGVLCVSFCFTLWGMPNVILCQHTSGSSPYNADRITQIFLDNLGRYRHGEALHNQVDIAQGY